MGREKLSSRMGPGREASLQLPTPRDCPKLAEGPEDTRMEETNPPGAAVGTGLRAGPWAQTVAPGDWLGHPEWPGHSFHGFCFLP